ncbi:hypothetical protein GIB67_041812 [Kingdonia uniflora]|uniref:Uncharacterized protein n=1 Tax=Kingdonia uniflora TaxID=39325 RepID=A0A7J7L5V0_9MAGN|nr:hypothetical protein GIB67_041812 [Kingdonia uniflora]
MLSKQRLQSPSNAPEMEALSPNDVPVVLIDMHTCSLDSKIKMNLENAMSSIAKVRLFRKSSQGDRFPMDRQIANLREEIIPELQRNIVGDITIEGFLAKSLFYSNIGSNDYLTNYLYPPSYEPILYPVPAYRDHLIEVYTAQLKELHNLGARKFLISGLATFGCIPFYISIFSRKNDKCVDKFNKLAREFNSKLKTAVQ